MTLSEQKAQFFQSLARLTKAGIPVVKAAETLGSRGASKHQLTWVADLQTGLSRGETISEALRGNGSNLLSSTDITLLTASEKGGKLDQGAAHLAKYHAAVALMERRTAAAMMRPALTLVVALLVAGLLNVVGGSGGVVHFFLPLISGLAICLLLGWAIYTWVQAARFRPDLDRALNCIPVVRRLRKSAAMGRFNRVLAISLQAGLPVSESLSMATRAAESGALTVSMQPVIESAQDGISPGSLLMINREIPANISHRLNAAEVAGDLDVAAMELALEQEQEMQLAADSFANWAPRIVGGLVGAYAIYKIFTFYAGYFRTIESLGNM